MTDLFTQKNTERANFQPKKYVRTPRHSYCEYPPPLFFFKRCLTREVFLFYRILNGRLRNLFSTLRYTVFCLFPLCVKDLDVLFSHVKASDNKISVPEVIYDEKFVAVTEATNLVLPVPNIIVCQ